MSTVLYAISQVPPDQVPELERSLKAVPRIEDAHVDLERDCVVLEETGAEADEVIAVLRRAGIEPHGAAIEA